MPDAPTFTNPVYPGYFADPFVLRHDGAYYAYGTNSRDEAPAAFEVLRSTDLVHWTSLGRCLKPIDHTPRDYWAPEVAVRDGRFYLYYSVGIEDREHVLRVAIADRPEGPFTDSGAVLTPHERFAIDPHPFQDDDGQWYLYYARDRLEGERVGTSLAVDRLVDMTSLAGDPKPVLAATAPWQLFLAQRPMYGAVYDWYTLEAPFVVKRDRRYWCFYSGGAWTSPGYGVSWAVADSPLGPFVEPDSDGPALLRSGSGALLGAGHNAVIEGPDGQDYVVYHAWDPEKTARRLCLDRLEWGVDGPRTAGPTAGPQPVPRAESTPAAGLPLAEPTSGPILGNERLSPPPRTAELVLVTRGGEILGQLPPEPVATPWWQDAEPVVAAVRDRHGVDVTILRMLRAELPAPAGGRVTYLAQVAGELPPGVELRPWDGQLSDHPLRQAYARPGGPDADLAWADSVLAQNGLERSGPPRQMRTWNLSSLWRIPLRDGVAWLKVVPPFFAHEGALLERLAGGPVPAILGWDHGRILMPEIPGDDLYGAGLEPLSRMVSLLVGLQREWLDRTPELLDLGLPDWRGPALTTSIAAVADRTGDDLGRDDRAALSRFVEALPDRWARVREAGLGDTLVHGDFHAGNVRRRRRRRRRAAGAPRLG